MRIPFTIALLGFSIAGVAAAGAADLAAGRYSGGEFSSYAQRSALLVTYDNEPGIVVRAYWRAPWRDHHYFPFSRHRPKIGRAENLSAISHPKPARTFRRSWSNAWAFEHSLKEPAQLGAGQNTDASPSGNDVDQPRIGSRRHREFLKRRRLLPR